MRIEGLYIYGFGCWIDTKLDFKKDYQIILGNNETGKTTLLYFIRSILFGFATKRGQEKYWRYWPRKSSKYGGELYLIDEQANHWTIRRTKIQNVEKLEIFKNEQQTSFAEYQHLLEPMNAQLFTQTNVIDHSALQSVYNLSNDELLERILAVGAIGSNSWLKLQQLLQKDADDLYRPRGKNYELNQLLEKDHDLRQKLTKISDENQIYRRLEEQLQQLSQQIVNLQQEYQDLQQTIQQQKNLAQNWSNYQELQFLSTNFNDDQEISLQDWESYLQLKQQLTTQQELINKIQQQYQELKLSDTQLVQLEYFQNHQNEFATLAYQKQQLAFQKQNLELQILPQLKDLRKQQAVLLQNNPQLNNEIKPLTHDQLQQFQQLLTQENSQPVSYLGIKKLILGLVSLIIAGSAWFLTHNWILSLLLLILVTGVSYGWVSLHSFSAADLQIRTKIQSFKQQYNLDNLSDHEVVALQGVIAQLTDIKSQIAANQQIVENYQSEYKHWSQQTELLVNNSQLSNISSQSFSDFYQECQQLQQIQELNQTTKYKLSQQLAHLQNELESYQQQIVTIEKKYQVNSSQDLEKLYDQTQQSKKLKQRYKVLQETLQPILTDLQKITDKKNLDNIIQQSMQKNQHLQQKIQQMNEQKANIIAQEQQLANDDQYQQLLQDIEFNNTAIAKTFEKWLANILAAQWINQTLNQATANRLPHLLTKAQQFFSQLTDNHFVKIEFSKQNLTVITKNQDYFDVHELSRGTAVQLYLAISLAFTLEMADLTRLPILIDDAFVDFDQSRLPKIVDIMRQISDTSQIIYVGTDKGIAHLFDTQHILVLKG